MTVPVATLASLLTTAALRDPDGPAIREPDNIITWSEANARAGRMAAALVDAGVAKGDRVGVHYRKSADAFLAMHAVVQQGAIAVPLDPTATGAYLTSVIEQAGCRTVLTHPACKPSIVGIAHSGRIQTFLGIDQSIVPAAPNEDLMRSGLDSTTHRRPSFIGQSKIDTLEPLAPIEVNPDDPAYLITTSGSTGTPKGICHSHDSGMAFVHFMLEMFDITPEDRISDIAPNHFDLSTLALWLTPFVGASNVIVPDQHQMFPASLAKLAADQGITIWYSVPYLLTQLLKRGDLANNPNNLRRVIFAGEVFPATPLRALMKQWPTVAFSNAYGPAEVNVCTVHHLAGPPEGDTLIPIGRPAYDTMIKVVDENGVAVADGDKGEVWVAGSTRMLGYWQRTDLDNAAFVSKTEGKGCLPTVWYRTGDLGWVDADGDYVFAGRVDHQIKVRGHRVELESIESILEEAEGVTNAVATVSRADDGSDVLIAGVAGSTTADSAGLKAFLAGRLPSYAMPAAFYPLTHLPTTGSGKLDRKLLRMEIGEAHLEDRNA